MTLVSSLDQGDPSLSSFSFSSSRLLSGRGASGHNSNGGGGGFHELSEGVNLFLAGAKVWVVLINVLNDLSLEFEFEGEIVTGSEELPEIGSEGHDHASKGVKSLEEVEAEFRSGRHNNSLDKERCSVGDLIGSSLPSVNGHWDGGSDAGSRNRLSALFHFGFCFCFINL